MKRMMLVAVVVAMVAVQSALADTVHFEAFLDGIQETPPNASPASGHATAILDPVTNQLCVHTEFSGLTANQTAAHVHLAPPGTAGGVILPLNFGSPSDTCGILTATQADSIRNQLGYVNVHTTNFPGGEIRGQLGKVPEPSSLALLCIGSLTLLRRRR